MEKEKKLVKRQNVEIIVLVVIIVALLSVCVYMLFLKKDINQKELVNSNNIQEKECNCPKCDECEKCEKVDSPAIDYSVDPETNVPLACTIDMANKTKVKVYDTKCGDEFDLKDYYYRIRVKNLKYNGKNYTFTYVLTNKDTMAHREDYFGIVKLYIGPYMIDAYDAEYQNIFYAFEIKGNKLIVGSGSRTDIPRSEKEYDLSKIIK